MVPMAASLLLAVRHGLQQKEEKEGKKESLY